MGEQYFEKTPSVPSDRKRAEVEARGRALRFVTDAGVFSRGHLDRGTALLLSALPEAFSGRALDLGCGWGPVGCFMAAWWPGAEVILSDVNERAVTLARENLSANGLSAQALASDGLRAVPGDFSLIATNPPIRAGKAVVYRLLSESAERLAPGGALYVVIRKQQGADSAARFLKEKLPEVSIVERGGGFRVYKATA